MIILSEMIAATSEQEVREIKSRQDLKIINGLEEWSGADMIISPTTFPITEVLLRKHVERGALLIQIKRGHDMLQSIFDERLHKSLALMRSCGARSWQCVLLFVGALHNADGQAVINGTAAKWVSGNSYWALRAALSKWMKRGGVVEHIPMFKEYVPWVEMQERQLEEMIAKPVLTTMKPTKFSLPEGLGDPNDPLQDLQIVSDWRRTMSTFPGMGPVRVQALYETILSSREISKDQSVSLFEALFFLTTYDLAKTVPGLGKGICDSARGWLGLREGMDLCMLPISENLELALETIGGESANSKKTRNKKATSSKK